MNSIVPPKIRKYLQDPVLFPDYNNKTYQSSNYNYIFNQTSGTFIRWGLDEEDNPLFSPIGPEILDLEVSTICHGIQGNNCRFCYKNNSGKGKNMSFSTFKTIFHKIPSTLTQIAFGIGDLDSNPDLQQMIQYCRSNPNNLVIPNITINGEGLNDFWASFLAKKCGAIAVSHYNDDICFNAVEKLTIAGLNQVNIHQLVAEETYLSCKSVLESIRFDSRLRNMYAIVFLMLKPKGGGSQLTPLTQEKFAELIDYALKHSINIGFDSCSAKKVVNILKTHPDFEDFSESIESCESSLFSAYINVEGQYFPCSFLENENIFSLGLDVVHCQNFLEEIWNHLSTVQFRKNLLQRIANDPDRHTSCPYYLTNQ